jgi:hypothetical protein
MPTTHTIRADHVQLCLVAALHFKTRRWAAVSAGVATPACQDRKRGASWSFAMPATCGPLYAGRLAALLARVRLHFGRPEVQRTWGAGMRSLQAEFGPSLRA